MRVPPPSACSATTSPPCDSATWRTIASPSPEPGMPARGAGAIEAVEDVGQVLVGDARTVVSHRQPSVAHRDLDLAAGRAPLRRVVEQVRRPHARASRGRPGRSPARGRRCRRPRGGSAGRARPRPRRGGRAERPPARRSSAPPAPARSAPRSRSSSHRAAPRRPRADARDPPEGACGRPASTSMFVRTLVSGVRSSCDASATSWRCARVDSSSAPSIVLKLDGEPTELVVARRPRSARRDLASRSRARRSR